MASFVFLIYIEFKRQEDGREHKRHHKPVDDIIRYAMLVGRQKKCGNWHAKSGENDMLDKHNPSQGLLERSTWRGDIKGKNLCEL